MIETIKRKQQGESIVQRVQIRSKAWLLHRGFEHHLRRCGIRAIFDQPLPEDDNYIIGITKLIMSTNDKTEALDGGDVVAELMTEIADIEMEGHLIDSQMLTRVLDKIMDREGV